MHILLPREEHKTIFQLHTNTLAATACSFWLGLCKISAALQFIPPKSIFPIANFLLFFTGLLIVNTTIQFAFAIVVWSAFPPKCFLKESGGLRVVLSRKKKAENFSQSWGIPHQVSYLKEWIAVPPVAESLLVFWAAAANMQYIKYLLRHFPK